MVARPAIPINTVGGVGDVTISVTGLTGTGLSLVDNGDGSGEITGTIPTGAKDSSPFSVTVTAEDEGDGSDTEPFTITVDRVITLGTSPTFSGSSGMNSMTVLAEAVAASDQWFIIARDGTATLAFYDWSDPTNIGSASSYSVSEVTDQRSVDATASLIAIAGDASVCHLYSWTSAGSSSVTPVAQVRGTDDYTYVRFLNDDTLILCSDTSMYVYDVSTPASPSLSATVALTGHTTVNGCAVAEDGSKVAVSDSASDRITIVDTSTPGSASLAGSVVDATDLNGVTKLAVVNNNTLCAVRNNNAIAVDWSTPSSPTVVGSVNTGMNPTTLGEVPDSIYVIASAPAQGLKIFEFSDPTAPTVHASTSTSSLNEVDLERIGFKFPYCIGASSGENQVRTYDLSP